MSAPKQNSEDRSRAGAQHCRKELIIPNELGLHARPAALFVKTTSRFNAEITVDKNGEEVNGKSIMGLMMLAAAKGTTLIITATGPEAEAAVKAVEELFHAKFNEQ
jgi:phosphocarrier protein HPr